MSRMVPVHPTFLRQTADRVEKTDIRIAELEAAIRFLSHAAYRDGATSLVAATALDEALALVGLPRVEGRELGQAVSSVDSPDGLRKIQRDESTPEGKAFWDGVREAAKPVKNWPDWMKAGINVSPQYFETYQQPSSGPGEAKWLQEVIGDHLRAAELMCVRESDPTKRRLFGAKIDILRIVLADIASTPRPATARTDIGTGTATVSEPDDECGCAGAVERSGERMRELELAVSGARGWLTSFADQLSDHAYQELESVLSDAVAMLAGGKVA
jgi:hypothetical protein